MKHEDACLSGTIGRQVQSPKVEVDDGEGLLWSDVGSVWHDVRAGTPVSARLLVIAPLATGALVRHAVTGLGARVIDCVPPAKGLDALATIVSMDAVIVDCRQWEPFFEDVLVQVDLLSAREGVRVGLISNLDGLDALYSLGEQASRANILCSPSLPELAASLRNLLHMPTNSATVRDGSSTSMPDFGALGEELRQLRALVEQLAFESRGEAVQGDRFSLKAPTRTFRAQAPHGNGAVAETPLQARQVRALIRARRQRDDIMPGDLFADPAWDIMLDLMAAELEGSRVSVSSLCIAAAVPPTTALRWIKLLTERGLLERRADNADGRRVFITLSVEGYRSVERWFVASAALLRDAAG